MVPKVEVKVEPELFWLLATAAEVAPLLVLAAAM